MEKSTSRKRKQEGLFSKRVVRDLIALVFIFAILFTISFIVTGGQEQTALVTSVFDVIRYELLALAGIRISKSGLEMVKELAEARKDNKGEDINYG